MLKPQFMDKPQWLFRERLVKAGESVAFTLYVPSGMDKGDLRVHPRYLEEAGPREAGEMPRSPSDRLDFTPDGDGYAEVTYRPAAAGNYLLTWQVGGETLQRYFGVAEDDTVVVNFSTFFEVDPQPTFHDFGIPVDYKLRYRFFKEEDPNLRTFQGYHRTFGDLIIVEMPDTPDIGAEQRVAEYGQRLERMRELLPDENDFRSIRIEMRHYLDPGYVKALKELGAADFCGLWEANAVFYLGMPEFVYYPSEADCRKTEQDAKGSIIAHQWDFCAGFHFPGPVTWHYGSSHGDWDFSKECVRDGIREAANSARMSGHPFFLTPLYEGLTAFQGYIEQKDEHYLDGRLAAFIEKFKAYYALEATKEFKLVFARSIDVADYFLRHHPVTPKTVYSSKTDHIHYDSWWQCQWTNHNVLAARERHPWDTKPSEIFKYRADNARTETPWGLRVPYKDSLSCEFLVVEDRTKSVRFERECPNPLWWFDYTDRRPFYTNREEPVWKVTPDVKVIRRTEESAGEMSLTLTLETKAEFEDYMIVVWGMPASILGNESLRTEGAKEHFVATNKDGECHLILTFDLKPGAMITVAWRT